MRTVLAEATDGCLVLEASRGNPEAFACLVRRHSDLVYRVALRVLGNEEDAKDASQEAWIRAWGSMGRFGGKSAFTTWLYRVTVNACLNYRRGNACVEHLELRDDTLPRPGLALPGFGDPGEGGDDPENETLDRETAEDMGRLLMEIRAEHRAALVLRHVEGLGYPEVADALGVSQPTARAWVSRGRAEMIVVLSRDPDFRARSVGR